MIEADSNTSNVRTISAQAIQEIVRSSSAPAFLLPTRFAQASFDNFQVSERFPEHEDVIAILKSAIQSEESSSLRFWQRKPVIEKPGVYLLGPPGIGKTHLLAAAYLEAEEPKIFASFDELAAAVASMGVFALGDLLAGQRFVCIDEITLDDPGNIMLLTSLIQRMLEERTRIFASANLLPGHDNGVLNSLDTFRRELGAIASAFEVLTLQGDDYRQRLRSHAVDETSTLEDPLVELVCSWNELVGLLDATHPMYDARWLERIDNVMISDHVTPFDNIDQAIRFVRFIDRVYDRAVGFKVSDSDLRPSDILRPLHNDRRFTWHLARCQSRLQQLLRS